MAHRSLVLALALSLVAVGCASSGKTEGQKQGETLGKNLRRCTDSLTQLDSDLKSVITAHEAVVNNTDGNISKHFQSFNKGIDKLEKSRQVVQARYDAVTSSAETFFATWKTGSEQFSSDSLRRSSERLREKLQSEFSDIWEESSDGKKAYEELVAILRDHKLFLSTALNPQSAAELKRDDKKIRNLSTKISEAIAETTKAATEFDESVVARAKAAKAEADAKKEPAKK